MIKKFKIWFVIWILSYILEYLGIINQGNAFFYITVIVTNPITGMIISLLVVLGYISIDTFNIGYFFIFLMNSEIIYTLIIVVIILKIFNIEFFTAFQLTQFINCIYSLNKHEETDEKN